MGYPNTLGTTWGIPRRLNPAILRGTLEESWRDLGGVPQGLSTLEHASYLKAGVGGHPER